MQVAGAVQGAFGVPNEVVEYQSNAGELRQPEGSEVLVKMRFAPINPADVNVLEGTYMTLPRAFPHTPGMEGSGVVLALGPDAEGQGLQEGDAVFLRGLGPSSSWSHGGTWKSHVMAPNPGVLTKVPADKLEQASMMVANPPTAYGLLQCARMRPGDWVVQNAGNSGVGCAVIVLCQELGFECVSVVRREETAERLREELGAKFVFSEEKGAEVEGGVSALILSLLQSQPDAKPVVRLALNAVGGESARQIARCLSPQGVHVTYGAMGRDPITVPNPYLIFKGLTFRGFHLSYYYKEISEEENQSMWDLLLRLLDEGKLHVRIEKCYPLEDVKTAVLHAWKPESLSLPKDGKILLDLGDSS